MTVSNTACAGAKTHKPTNCKPTTAQQKRTQLRLRCVRSFHENSSVVASATALALVPALLVEKAAVRARPRIALAPHIHVRVIIELGIKVLASGMVLNMDVVLVSTEKGSNSKASNGDIPPVIKICMAMTRHIARILRCRADGRSRGTKGPNSC
mmetsp:Transcript_7375/g.15924  ORF Transcript_7375/g.15924 Transcript_7375/m.15924 type:complete len:154 (-) Transcript_7375:46-507(-)